MKIKLLLAISVLLLFIPISVSAVGIGWYTEDIEIPYRESSCVDYLIYNAESSDIVAYLEVEGELEEVIESIYPKEVRLPAGTLPEDGQIIKVCFKGKQNAEGQVLASSQILTSSVTGSAVGLSSAAPLRILVDNPNYLLPSMVGLIGSLMILSALFIRKFK